MPSSQGMLTPSKFPVSFYFGLLGIVLWGLGCGGGAQPADPRADQPSPDPIDRVQPGNLQTDEPDEGALAAVRAIMKQQSLPANFIVRAGEVENAEAFTQNGRGYILYNRKWMEGLKKDTKTMWAVYAVLAHEIGHLLMLQTLPGAPGYADLTREEFQEQELDADYFAGAALARLGATREQIQSIKNIFVSSKDSTTHPIIEKRMQAFVRGWMSINPDDPKASPLPRRGSRLKINPMMDIPKEDADLFWKISNILDAADDGFVSVRGKYMGREDVGREGVDRDNLVGGQGTKFLLPDALEGPINITGVYPPECVYIMAKTKNLDSARRRLKDVLHRFQACLRYRLEMEEIDPSEIHSQVIADRTHRLFAFFDPDSDADARITIALEKDYENYLVVVSFFSIF